MSDATLQISIFDERPLARLLEHSFDVLVVSEIALAVEAGCTVEIRRTTTPGERFDDRPRALRRECAAT